MSSATMPIEPAIKKQKTTEMAEAEAKPTFSYFETMGRGMPMRVSLYNAFGKDGWVDDRCDFRKWAAFKPQTPMGSVPVLTLPDGHKVTQTDVVARWCAKQGENPLYPSGMKDQALVDEVSALVAEGISMTPADKDPAVQKEKRATYAQNYLKRCLKRCEDLLDVVPGDFVLGDQLSIADLHLCGLSVTYMSEMPLSYQDRKINNDKEDIPGAPKEVMDDMKKLQAHIKKVHDHPLMKDYESNYTSHIEWPASVIA